MVKHLLFTRKKNQRERELSGVKYNAPTERKRFSVNIIKGKKKNTGKNGLTDYWILIG